MKRNINTVDDYIVSFPEDVQKKLREMRQLIKENSPEAVEGMSYGMPAYKLCGKPLVYFGGFAKHIGFYATPSGHEKFKSELSAYKQGKGSVQFPLHEPLPSGLISEIVIFRTRENSRE